MGNTWRYPECETINTDDKCIICGAKRTIFDNQEDKKSKHDILHDKILLKHKENREEEKNSPIKNFTNKWKIIGITSMGIAAISVGLVIGFASALSNKNDNNIIIPISTTLREYSENPNSYDQSASDWETDSSYSNKKMIPVPDLLNLSREEAISTCLDAGLDYSFDVKPSDRTEKNIVISQAISPNTLVPVGTKLEFIVSN